MGIHKILHSALLLPSHLKSLNFVYKAGQSFLDFSNDFITSFVNILANLLDGFHTMGLKHLGKERIVWHYPSDILIT